VLVLAHAHHYWHLEPPLILIAVAALLYTVGLRRRVSRRREARVEAVFFAAGLGALALALASPLAVLDEELFSVHMTQHVLLLTVAPPLILLGRPWSTSARALPLGVRRATARGLVFGSWSRTLRAALGLLASPPVALALFCGTLVAWHVPALFDATLSSSGIHELEHALFLATGLLFWSQLIDAPPFRSRLDYPMRAVYAALAMIAGSVLGLALGLASTPLYAGYADLVSRPGGISGLVDQHIAAGIMWVPGSIPFALAFVVFLYRWLGEASTDVRRAASPFASES
jgi:putative membrane protein